MNLSINAAASHDPEAVATTFAEPPVTVVDAVAKRHGTEKMSDTYLKFFYTKEGQEIIAQNF